MTRTNRFQSRVAFTLALMLALAGILGAVRVSTLPAAAQVIDSVVVSCDAPGADGSTTCVISAPDAEQLAVPAGGVCGTVASSSGAFDGASYVSASGDPTVVLTFATPVAAGGGATYTVTSGGVSSAVGGSGIVCIDPPAAPLADETSNVELPVEETDVFAPPTEEQPADEQTVDPNGDTPADDGAGTVDEGAAPEETDGTGADGTTDETGNGDEGGSEAGLPVAPANVIVDPGTPNDPPPAPVAVTVTIVAYQCETDPGLTNPVAAGCVAASGIVYAASDTSGDLGTATTDGSGVASFASTTGAAFLVAQSTNISGYRTIGDGRYEVLSLDGDTTITFVNVRMQELGRLQIAAGLCPTSGESRTEFSIADQNNFGAASLMSCEANGEAIFTVSSPALPSGSWVVRTESDGSWRGFVPAGTYTVTAPDGTVSPSIVVANGAVSVAVAVSYVHQIPGTLLLEHYFCTAGTDGEVILVNPAGAPDASCSLAAATVTVSEFDGSPSEVITIAQNGSTPVSLKAGHYVAEGPQGTSQDFNITAETTTVVRVLTTSTTGVLMIDASRCPAGVIPTDPTAQCTTAWGGVSLSLIPGGGSPIAVAVSGGGTAVIDALAPGVYTLGGGNVCAVLSGGVDVSDGFTIAAGQTTSVSIFGCFAADDGTGSPDPGNGTGGTGANPPGDGTGGNGHPVGNTGGGDGTGVGGSNGAYGSNSAMTVTQLPNTGSGSGVSNYWWPMLLLALAVGMAFTGSRLKPQIARRER